VPEETCSIALDFESAINTLNSVSLGASRFVPVFLCGPWDLQAHPNLRGYEFSTRKGIGELAIYGVRDNDYLEIFVSTDNGLISKIRMREQVQELSHIKSLQDALELFGAESSAEDVQRTEETIRLLSTRAQEYTLQTKYDYRVVRYS